MSRVVLIGPVYPYRGGIAHFTTMLGRALQEEHELKIISFRRQYPRWLYPGRTDRDPSAHPLTIEAEFLLDPLHPLTWFQAAARIKKWNPSVVLIQWWTTFWAPCFGLLARLLRKEGRRVLFLVHNVLPHERGPLDRQLARFALAAGTGWVVLSEGQKALLEDILPGASPHVRKHPAYPTRRGRDLDRQTARRELEVPSNAEVALHFGLVRPYKGLGDLIRAIAILHRQGRRVYLVIAGEFWENKRRYLAELEALQIAEYTRVHDRYVPDEEVGVYFRAADVLVAPYRGGSQSGVVQLAAGYGLPCVVTSASTDSDLSVGDSKIAAPRGNPKALAQAISNMLDQTEPGPRVERSADPEWRTLARSLVQPEARR